MKSEHLTFGTVVDSAYWIVCCFALLGGLFLPYGLGNIGFIPLDEVIVVSSVRVGIALFVLIPVQYLILDRVTTILKERIKGGMRYRDIFLIPILLLGIFGCISGAGKIARSMDYHATSWIGVTLFFASGLIIFMSLILVKYYHRVSVIVVTSSFISVVFVFFSGVATGADARDQVVLSKVGKKIACGILIYEGRSGVFIRKASESSISYLKAEAFDRVDRKPCGAKE